MVTPLRSSGFSQSRQRSARGTLRIAETFLSRQGEGKLTGQESFFIRTSGCNLRCWFCDTPYASWHPEGDHRDIDELVEMALQSGSTHVVLTGGEPLLPSNIDELCQKLRERDLHLTIETAGTIDREVDCDLMSISPKFASSAPDADQHPAWHRLHEQRRRSESAIQSLIRCASDYQLKFVVESTQDFAELQQSIETTGAAAEHVWVMPQGTTVLELDESRKWLEPWCEQHGFQYCDRMQIRWYGNRKGT